MRSGGPAAPPTNVSDSYLRCLSCFLRCRATSPRQLRRLRKQAGVCARCCRGPARLSPAEMVSGSEQLCPPATDTRGERGDLTPADSAAIGDDRLLKHVSQKSH